MAADPFPPGFNPRKHFGRKHRERGRARFGYSIADVAEAAGVSVNTARQVPGLVEATKNADLLFLARYILRKELKRMPDPPEEKDPA